MNLSLLFAGLLIHSAHRGPSAVSYRTTGKNLAEICGELSALTSQDLECSRYLGSEIMALNVHDAPISEIKGRLATLTHGVWAAHGNREVLEQPNSAKRTDERFHQRLLVAAFQRSLDLQARTLGGQKAFDQVQASAFASQVAKTQSLERGSEGYAASVVELAEKSPASRAVRRLLGSFQAEQFANLPVRIRVVYSNDPNRAQLSLPSTAMAVGQEFVREQALWTKASDPSGDLTSTLGQPASLTDFLIDRSVPRGIPSKLLIGLYRESENGRIRIDLKLADKAGRVLCRAQSALTPKFDPSPSASFQDDHTTRIHATESELELAPGGFQAHPVSSQVQSALLDPTKTDPLSICYGQLLCDISQQENVNLVALLSDQLADGGWSQSDSMTEAQYFARLAEKGQESNISKGYLTVAPRDFYFEHASRAERLLVKEFVRGSTSDEFPLSSQATCALGLPDPLDNLLPSQLVSILKQRLIGLRSVALLRFLGSLSEEDLRTAGSQSGFRLSSLSSTSLGCLNEMVYADMGTLMVRRPEEIQHDPSECLEAGFSPSSYFTIQTKTTPAIFDLSRDRLSHSFSQGSVTAGELAFAAYQRAHPEKFPPSQPSSEEARYRLGTYSQYQFKFYLTPDVTSSSTLDARYLDGPILQLENLPADFLAQIAAQYSQIEHAEASMTGPSSHPKTSTP